MPTHLDIIAALEEVCPLSLQETWDNSGWQVCNPHLECTGAILAVEATEATVQEALETGCNLLIIPYSSTLSNTSGVGLTKSAP